MARLKCICGESLSNSTDPIIQFHPFSDKEWIELMSVGKIDPIYIKWPKLEFWKCTNCGRLHFFVEGRDEVLARYKLEEGTSDWPDDTARGYG